VKLTKPIVDQWRKHKDYYCKEYYAYGCNAVGLLTGSKRLSQFNGGKVLVTYTLKQKSYGGYMWMPLPGSPCFSQDFALITLEQKQVVDNYFFDPDNHTMPLMDPEQFRRWMINLLSENGVDSFVRLMNLQSGMTYFGEKCIMFIVSVVSDKEMETLAENETSH
jgi:hypothetical protein